MKKKSSQPYKPEIPKSKYEFNLAEFPVTVLSKRIPMDLKVIEYEDTIAGKGGEIVSRKWTVSPSVQYSFGTTEALGILFELFQIWKEQRFESPIIRFGSLYNLIKRLGLDENTATNYERLRKNLNALVGITIEAKNAFWDNEKKVYVDATFHLFDRLYLARESRNEQKTFPFAYIEASRELWGSIESNALMNIKGVNSKLFRSLTPTEQRLGLYLAKMLHKKTEYRRDVKTLAHQLPILAEKYKHTKEQLTKACDGLIEKGWPYITSYHYEKGAGGKTENICFSRKSSLRKAKQRQQEESEEPLLFSFPKRSSKKNNDAQELLVQDILEVTHDGKSENFYCIVAQKMDEQTIRRALSEVKAEDIPLGTVGNRGAYFTRLIQKYAAEQGITLNPRKRR